MIDGKQVVDVDLGTKPVATSEVPHFWSDPKVYEVKEVDFP